LLERDLTKTNGLINKSLPLGWYFYRFPDTGGRKRNPQGCDGLLMFGKHVAYFLEVKIGNGKLTESEQKLFKWCHDNKRPYFLLRYYEKENLWVMEDLVFNNIKVNTGNLKDIVEELVDYC